MRLFFTGSPEHHSRQPEAAVRVASGRRRYLAFIAMAMASAAGSYPAYAAEQQPPVNFAADQLLYDDQADVVTAVGSVRLEQEGRVVTADSILYNIREDKVTAVGHVVLTEPDGSKYYADKVRLRQKMQEGYVSYLKGELLDGGQFKAAYAERSRTTEEGDRIVMHDASYTACAPCQTDPESPPLWQLHADSVIHERDQKQISYENATFELGGVPVLWTPYFSHPDGTEKQKSGLISPTLGYNSVNGGYGGASYYYAIDEDKDATVGLTAYTRELPVLSGDYRQRFTDAAIDLSGTMTYSGRIVELNGVNTHLSDEFRGNLEFSGGWDINQEWRSGFDLNLTSDDQYLRQYDLSDDDILENQIYLERFSGRNYTDIRLIGFQDIRLLQDQENSPNILPEITMSFLGQPGQTLGGRWSFDASALSLQRDGSDPDTNRLSTNLGWQGRRISDTGIVTKLDLGARGDLYLLTDQNGGENRTKSRGYVVGQLESSYPLLKTLPETGGQVILEPVAALTVASHVNSQLEIQNEDSQDIQVGVNNLFDINRFAGYDRIEDRSRLTYGLRSSYVAPKDLEFSAFAGQSYNLESRDSFFPQGSGLNEHSSDYVGEINARYKDILDLNYRTQLDRTNFGSKRHEAGVTYQNDRIELEGMYFFSKAIEGTNFNETREQLHGRGRLRLSDHWYVSGGASYDLGADPGLRSSLTGVEYVGECLGIGAFMQRDLTQDNSGDPGTEISIRIGLKNLGNFEASGLNVSDNNN
ncbi:MAG: LPS-assembly protein LptD [Rhodospirillales bacterium]|nr:LPS-assembly protein LptD [Rhodospirillales bacterium]MCB9973031.1 LPS-assembly protein LptD [Rhodospirillales bacterium]